MKRLFAYGIAVVFLAVGCIQELQGFLVIVLTQEPPDTTSALQVTIAGEVGRNPKRQFLTTVVTVTGGAATAVDTTDDFKLFSVTVPLVPDTANVLSITASDNTGATMTGPLVRTVVQQSAPLAPPSDRAGR